MRLAKIAVWAGLLPVALPHSARAQAPNPATRLLDILMAAYPDHLASHADGILVWKDDTRMAFHDGRGPKDLARLFAAPTPLDMFHWTYPLGTPSPPPEFPADPGRVRVAAFFDKVYGDCTRGEVAGHLVPVAWLPAKRGGTVRITAVNGVAEKLAAVSAELDRLPARFDRFLKPTAGTYNCRAIAGTDRPSTHGWGIAIDLSPAPAHYWRWTRPDAAGRRPYRNAFPPEIVAVFEKHGFIWGGKWSHYDTMHFEYRPEILAAGAVVTP